MVIALIDFLEQAFQFIILGCHCGIQIRIKDSSLSISTGLEM
jgi:hypothetical protein